MAPHLPQSESLTLALLHVNPFPCAIVDHSLSVIQANTRFMAPLRGLEQPWDFKVALAHVIADVHQQPDEDCLQQLLDGAVKALSQRRKQGRTLEAHSDEVSAACASAAVRVEFHLLDNVDATTSSPGMVLIVKPLATHRGDPSVVAHAGSSGSSQDTNARPYRELQSTKPAHIDLDVALAGYRFLSEAMPIIVWTARPDGSLDYLSSAASHYTDPGHSLLGRQWETLLHPNDLQDTLARWTASVSTGVDYVTDHRFRQTDGTYRWMRSLARPVRLEDDRIVRWVGATVDVNDPKNIELDRLRLESRYRALVTVASNIAYVADAEGRFTSPQPSWERYTGQPWEKHCGHGWAEMLHPDDRSVAQEALDLSLAKDVPYRADVRIWHAASSTYRRCQVRAAGTRGENGRTQEWVGMITDVEESLRTAQSLREERARLDLSVEAAEIGTFHCPIPLGRIVWNLKCKEHFWLSPNADVDFDVFYSRIHPGDREKTRAAIEQAVTEGTPYDIEYRTVSPDGPIRWLRAKGRTHVDDYGRPLRFDGITIDISRQKALEIERDQLLTNERLLRLEAQHASQLKDTFLATVSHELRTPLNAIQSWLYLLQRESVDESLLARGLMAIDRNAQSQSRLVDDLLDLSRIEAGKLLMNDEDVNLAPLLLSEIDDISLSAQAKKVEISSELPNELMVHGDAVRLRQVFSNLLSNALKYTDAQGHIRVSARSTGYWAEIQVADDGAGIPASFLPRVFEPFSQAVDATTRTSGGLGIGLAIAKSIVNLHGGSITVRSEGEGRGSVFVVQVPLSGAIAAAASVSPSIEEPPATQGQSLSGLMILLVEDEDDAREAMTAVLESAGATVTTAESAATARGLAKTRTFDVILSDIGMPHEDGYSLIESLRKCGLTTPAVAVTAFGRPEDKSRAFQAGFDSHLAKPVTPTRLFEVIRSVLQEASR